MAYNTISAKQYIDYIEKKTGLKRSEIPNPSKKERYLLELELKDRGEKISISGQGRSPSRGLISKSRTTNKGKTMANKKELTPLQKKLAHMKAKRKASASKTSEKKKAKVTKSSASRYTSSMKTKPTKPKAASAKKKTPAQEKAAYMKNPNKKVEAKILQHKSKFKKKAKSGTSNLMPGQISKKKPKTSSLMPGQIGKKKSERSSLMPGQIGKSRAAKSSVKTKKPDTMSDAMKTKTTSARKKTPKVAMKSGTATGKTGRIMGKVTPEKKRILAQVKKRMKNQSPRASASAANKKDAGRGGYSWAKRSEDRDVRKGKGRKAEDYKKYQKGRGKAVEEKGAREDPWYKIW